MKHEQIECGECGHKFSVDIDYDALTPNHVECPNCQNEISIFAA